MIAKKSFVFVVSDFDVGGITTSLRNLTDILIKEGHYVSIVNLPGSEQLPGFNPKIKLIQINGRARYWNLTMEKIRKAPLHKRHFLLFIGALKKVLNKTKKWHKFIFSNVMVSGFDVAIAFRQSPLCYSFVHDHTDAPRKIGFWHGDPEYLDGIETWINSLEDVDYVACVSRSVEYRMRKMFPRYSEKYKTIYNVFNTDEIKNKSKQFKVDYLPAFINIVTVSRIEFKQKQLDFIPQIAKRLKSNSFVFKWTIVGDGPDYKRLQQMIIEEGVEDCVRCVGNKPNPFPYVANADLFVNTSFGEAYGMVIVESMILGTPCVAGEYPALHEIITDGENGIIADNSIDGITEAIERLFRSSELFDQITQNIERYNYQYKDTYNMLMELC